MAESAFVDLRKMVDVFKAMEVMSKIGKPPKFAFTPSEVVYEEGKTKLLRYLPKTANPAPVPVFLVPSLINKYYILDLLPGKATSSFWSNRDSRFTLLIGALRMTATVL